MVNTNNEDRKEYKQPKMQIVEIDSADIIATSGDPEGDLDDM